MPARLVILSKRPWRAKVRWRDGTKNEAGRYIERSSQVFRDKSDAVSFKERVDREQRVRREMARSASGLRLLSLETIIERRKDARLAFGKMSAAFAQETKEVLLALCKDRRWTSTTDITANALDKWVADSGGKGVRNPFAYLRALLRYARDVLKQPVDPDVFTFRVPGVREKPQPPLLTAEQVQHILGLAREYSPACAYLLEHLSTYGCRPIDACRLTVGDFNEITGELTLRETKSKVTVVHPLLPQHVERYRKLCAGRAPDEPLFLTHESTGWRLSKHGSRAEQLNSWYQFLVRKMPADQRGIYLLKDYAVTALENAGVPDRDKSLFTGILTLAVYQRYKATNRERARAALDQLTKARQQGAVSAPQQSQNAAAAEPKNDVTQKSAPQVRPEKVISA